MQWIGAWLTEDINGVVIYIYMHVAVTPRMGGVTNLSQINKSDICT